MIKIVICGPPHSGKSVFIGGLSRNLSREDYYVFRANPDGEGNWTYKNEFSALYRKKRMDSIHPEEGIEWYSLFLRECTRPEIMIVDVGGRINEEKYVIMNECDAAIILSSDKEMFEKWEDVCKATGTKVFQKIFSDMEAAEDDITSPIMVCHHLDRNDRTVAERPCIKAIADKIYASIGDMGHSSLECVSKDPLTGKIRRINVLGLYDTLHSDQNVRALPSGKIIRQPVWRGEDLVEISRILSASEKEDVIDIEGPLTNWLSAAIAHECYPSKVRVDLLYDFVEVGCKSPSAKPSGKNLKWEVSPIGENMLVVNCNVEEIGVPVYTEDLSSVVPPEVPSGCIVILSGKIPIWLSTSIAMAYRGRCGALACFQPGNDIDHTPVATFAWSDDPKYHQGQVIPIDWMP